MRTGAIGEHGAETRDLVGCGAPRNHVNGVGNRAPKWLRGQECPGDGQATGTPGLTRSAAGLSGDGALWSVGIP